MSHFTFKKITTSLTIVFFGITTYVSAETVTGGGYQVQQVITPLQGGLSGNGFILNQAGQSVGGREAGGGYTLQSVFGGAVVATTSPPVLPPGGGGSTDTRNYYIFPNATSTGKVIIKTSTSTDEVELSGSSCPSRVTFFRPIDIGLSTNIKGDIEKLERFLNKYEGERLPVNGVYEQEDVAAVKRWQEKYRSFILDPMKLKFPTGTVYTLSQRQIERQTSKECGKPVVVNACPYFREYVSYGDRGENVKKVQLFLNIVRGENLPVSGVYGPLTREATKRFQRAYRKDVFNILKLSFISGNWNEATRIKANQAIGCDTLK